MVGAVTFQRERTMTIVLSQNTEPPKIEVKTQGCRIEGKQLVRIGDYFLPLHDFFVLAHYVMTNTDLEGPEDPRVQFVESVKRMQTIPGYSAMGRDVDSKSERYSDDESPFAVF